MSHPGALGPEVTHGSFNNPIILGELKFNSRHKNEMSSTLDPSGLRKERAIRDRLEFGRASPGGSGEATLLTKKVRKG